MKSRSLFLIVLVFGGGCQELPFFSQRPTSSADGGAASGGETGSGGQGGAAADETNGAGAAAAFFPGFGAMDASSTTSNAAEGIAIDDADVGSFSIVPPWDQDGGVGADALGFSFPDPGSLAVASAESPALALAGDARTMEVGSMGCGEPPTCYLRTIIATPHGNVYAARMSASYPKDTCVTKVVDCDHSVLVGDSNGRFGDPMCGGTTPQITLGFLLPQSLLFGWDSGQIWLSTSGFKSEWTLMGAGGDSGSYEPIPGFTSKIWPMWARFYAGGEVYGEMLVPLRQTMTHELAIGFALFDIRVRQ
jgi:hypothetical protein